MPTATSEAVRPLAVLFEKPRDEKQTAPYSSTKIGADDTGTWRNDTQDNDT